jgi:hypothetical protein
LETQVLKVYPDVFRNFGQGGYTIFSCKLWGLQGCDISSRGLLGCDAVQCCDRIPTFQRSMHPPS